MLGLCYQSHFFCYLDMLPGNCTWIMLQIPTFLLLLYVTRKLCKDNVTNLTFIWLLNSNKLKVTTKVTCNLFFIFRNFDKILLFVKNSV